MIDELKQAVEIVRHKVCIPDEFADAFETLLKTAESVIKTAKMMPEKREQSRVHYNLLTAGWNECRKQAILAAADITAERDEALNQLSLYSLTSGQVDDELAKIDGLQTENDRLKKELAKAELALFENDKEKQENYKEKWRKRAVKAEAEAEQLKKELAKLKDNNEFRCEACEQGMLTDIAKLQVENENLKAELSRVQGITVEDIEKAIETEVNKVYKTDDNPDICAAIHRLIQGVK